MNKIKLILILLFLISLSDAIYALKPKKSIQKEVRLSFYTGATDTEFDLDLRFTVGKKFTEELLLGFGTGYSIMTNTVDNMPEPGTIRPKRSILDNSFIPVIFHSKYYLPVSRKNSFFVAFNTGVSLLLGNKLSYYNRAYFLVNPYIGYSIGLGKKVNRSLELSFGYKYNYSSLVGFNIGYNF